VLVQLAHVMAPFTPFLAEELYQKLTGGESVHLRDWPAVGHIDELIVDRMALVREIINEGLSQRASGGVKVRQPLQSVTVASLYEHLGEHAQDLLPVVLEELNVKQVLEAEPGAEQRVRIDLHISPALKREGMVREVIRNVQNARKEAGLDVDDRIHVGLLATEPELTKAIKEHEALIATETLAESVVYEGVFDTQTACTIDGMPLTISLRKA
jgi:isoleucyl-tRNA synthetase